MLSYEDRVRRCELTTFERRRVRRDQMQERIDGLDEGRMDGGVFLKYSESRPTGVRKSTRRLVRLNSVFKKR